MSEKFYLAQVNIGRLLGGRDDPHLADFFANLVRVNALADRMPGFVWRLKDETGNAISIHWPGDPTMNVNLSVWESIEALEKFVFQTAHTRIYARKHEFFEKPSAPTVAMWWVPVGHIPTLDEAKVHLDHLIANGPSEFAFSWESVPQAKLWREARCA
jgi:hypothetical protein